LNQALKHFSVVVGADEVLEMLTEPIVAAVVIPSGRCFFQCSVHPLDLPIGPDQIVYRHELERLTAETPPTVYHVLSEPPAEWRGGTERR
jgi:hypothetical protein